LPNRCQRRTITGAFAPEDELMSGPVVYVSTWRVKAGAFDDYLRFHDRLVEVVKEEEPNVAAFLAFANDDGSEITGIHVFANAAALEHHMDVIDVQMRVSADDMSAFATMLDDGRIELFGARGDKALAMDRALESSVRFSYKSRYVGGFTRSA
jgi:hypothetical protein